METVGLILGLTAVALFVASVGSFFRKIPQLGLTSAFRSWMGILGSLILLVISGSMLPPSPVPPNEDGKPGQQEAVSAQTAGAEPRTSAPPALSTDGTTALANLNRFWRDAKQVGAFAGEDPEPVTDGANLGGSIQHACASQQSCVMIQTRADGRVVSLTTVGSTPTDGDAVETLTTMLGAPMAFGISGEKMGNTLQRHLQAAVQQRPLPPEELEGMCVAVSASPALGVWTTITAPPCRR